MKRNKKGNTAVIALIVILVVLTAGFVLYKKVFKKMVQSQNPTTQSTAGVSQQNGLSPTGSQTNSTPSGTSNSLSSGNTNTDLDKDMQTIGGKMNSVASAISDVDTSIQNQQTDSPSPIQ
jgi:uncharacterized protein HemX